MTGRMTAAIVAPSTILLLLLHFQSVFCLKLIRVEVPPHPVAGNAVPLHCIFDMEDDELYSVKWYKGSAEFYRFLPKDDPQSQVYDVTGVSVDLSLSGQDKVVLNSVEIQSSGHYRCEVSAESPSFITVHSEGEMNVIALPSEGPKITGGKPKYTVGDMVRVNCTSYQSKPAAMLSWTINDEKAPKEYLKQYPPIVQEQFLETSILGLQFQVRESHFTPTGMKLKCTATIAPIYHKSNEESVIGGNQQASVLESKETPHSQDKSPVTANRRNSGCSNSAPLWNHALIIFVLKLLQG